MTPLELTMDGDLAFVGQILAGGPRRLDRRGFRLTEEISPL
jgi:hypothetical protein